MSCGWLPVTAKSTVQQLPGMTTNAAEELNVQLRQAEHFHFSSDMLLHWTKSCWLKEKRFHPTVLYFTRLEQKISYREIIWNDKLKAWALSKNVMQDSLIFSQQQTKTSFHDDVGIWRRVLSLCHRFEGTTYTLEGAPQWNCCMGADWGYCNYTANNFIRWTIQLSKGWRRYVRAKFWNPQHEDHKGVIFR